MSANVQYYLKEKAKDYRGLIRQSFAIGKKDPLTLAQFLATLVRSACETAVAMNLVHTTEELQEAVSEAFSWCQGMIVEDVPDREHAKGATKG